MAEDFDDFNDEEYEGSNDSLDDFRDELDDPEFQAELKRRMQDCNDGFTYELLFDEDDEHIKMKCNKCGRIGVLGERPFPHKLECPMKDRVED
jgi:hypothetical protein